MKRILFLLALLITFTNVKAQSWRDQYNAQSIQWLQGRDYLGIPFGPTLPANSGSTSRNDPAIFFNTTDEKLYTWNTTAWVAGLGGSVNIYNSDGSIVDAYRTVTIQDNVMENTGLLFLANDLTANLEDMQFSIQKGGTNIQYVKGLTGDASIVRVGASGVSLSVENSTGGGTNFTIFLSNGHGTVQDQTTDQYGLKYQADYSATFIDRSLVDKGYVDGLVTAINLQTVTDAGYTTTNPILVLDNNMGVANTVNSSNAVLAAGDDGGYLQLGNGVAGSGFISSKFITHTSESYLPNVDAHTLAVSVNGEFANTDGDITLSGGGFGLWTDAGSGNMYNTSLGKVTIGNSFTGSEILNVEGSIYFSLALKPSGDAGSVGEVLTSQGSGAAPIWTAVSSGISIPSTEIPYGTGTGWASNSDFVYNTTGTGFFNIGFGGNVIFQKSGNNYYWGDRDGIGHQTHIKIDDDNYKILFNGTYALMEGANKVMGVASSVAFGGSFITQNETNGGELQLANTAGHYAYVRVSNLTVDRNHQLPNADGTYVLSINGTAPNAAGDVTISVGGSGWSTTGNTGLTGGTNYIGTTDNVDIWFKRNGSFAGIIGSGNTLLGLNAGNSGKVLNIGMTAVGVNALQTATATSNVAMGGNAGGAVTTGQRNSLFGAGSGGTLETGSFNTMLGYLADVDDPARSNSISIGYGATATADQQLAISNNVNHLNFPGFTTGAGYVLTDVLGNGILTLAPASGGGTTITAPDGVVLFGDATAGYSYDVNFTYVGGDLSMTGAVNAVDANFTGDITGSNIVITGDVNTTTVTASGAGTFSTVSAGAFTGNLTGNVSGNATTATALATPRNINGVSFDGTGNITVTAAAGTLTGTTLNSSVVTSSLTSVGTIGTGAWQGTIISPTYGGTGVNNGGRTLTISSNAGTITFTNSATVLTVANNASVSGTNTGDQTTITGNANSATTLVVSRNIWGQTFNGSAAVDGTFTQALSVNTSGIVSTGYSVTGSGITPLVDISGTWNTTGNVTAFKLNVVNTGSGTSSALMDLQVGGTSQVFINRNGVITSGGLLAASGNVLANYIYTSGTTSNANFEVFSSTVGIAAGALAGSSSSQARVRIGGNASTTITANNSYAGLLINQSPATIAATGTHPLFATAAFKASTITSGAGTLTNSATVYVDAAATGATNNYAIWSAAGVNRFGGSIVVNGTAPVASAIVDVNSTTQGGLFPRMTTTQKNAISSPAEGLIVYDLTLHKLCVYTGSAWETVTSL